MNKLFFFIMLILVLFFIPVVAKFHTPKSLNANVIIPSIQCEDTDGGINSLNFGKCTDSDSTFVDSCLPPSPGMPDSFTVSEQYCDSTCKTTQVSCDFGYWCEDGACKTVEEAPHLYDISSYLGENPVVHVGDVLPLTFSWSDPSGGHMPAFSEGCKNPDPGEMGNICNDPDQLNLGETTWCDSGVLAYPSEPSSCNFFAEFEDIGSHTLYGYACNTHGCSNPLEFNFTVGGEEWLYITYYDKSKGDLKFAKVYNWNDVSVGTIDDNGDVGAFNSIILDSNNTPHISYFDSGKEIKYATRVKTGGNCGPNNRWNCESIRELMPGSYPHAEFEKADYTTILLDNLERPQIVVNNDRESGTFLEYRTRTGGVGWSNCGYWTCEKISDFISGDNSAATMFNSWSQYPIITYVGQAPSKSDIGFAQFLGFSGTPCSNSGGMWNCNDIIKPDNGGGFGGVNMIEDSLELAAFEQNRGNIWYMKEVGSGGNCGNGTWECDIIDSDIDNSFNGLDGIFKVGIASNKYTTYLSYYDKSKGNLKVAYYTGAGNCGPDNTWQCDNLDYVGYVDERDGDFGSSIVYSEISQRFYVVYKDVDNGDLKLATTVKEGGNCGDGKWECKILDEDGDVGGYPDIAVWSD